MRRIPRTKGALSGFIIVLLGIWAGLVPFVGPYFHYAMHSNQHWQWFADRFWLEVLPAAVAVLGGLILMGGGRRGSTMLGGLLALAAGLWFIVGANVSIIWNHGAITVGPPMGVHNITRALEWIGFFYGVGALITMFASYALGVLAATPAIVEERVGGRTAAAGAGAAAGYAAGRHSGRRREREAEAADAAPAAPAATRVEEPTRANDPAVADNRAAADTGAAPRSRTGRFFRRKRTTTRT
jgi:hypothetical protein